MSQFQLPRWAIAWASARSDSLRRSLSLIPARWVTTRAILRIVVTLVSACARRGPGLPEAYKDAGKSTYGYNRVFVK